MVQGQREVLCLQLSLTPLFPDDVFPIASLLRLLCYYVWMSSLVEMFGTEQSIFTLSSSFIRVSDNHPKRKQEAFWLNSEFSGFKVPF